MPQKTETTKRISKKQMIDWLYKMVNRMPTSDVEMGMSIVRELEKSDAKV